MAKCKRKLNKSQILSLVLSCVVLVLTSFLSGCESKRDKEAREAEKYYRIGQNHFIARQYADALAACQKAISLKQDYAEAYLGMGRAYYFLRQYKNALAASEKAIALKPDFARAYGGIGMSYTELGQYTDAIAAYEKCIAIEPTGKWADFARERIIELSNRDRP